MEYIASTPSRLIKSYTFHYLSLEFIGPRFQSNLHFRIKFNVAMYTHIKYELMFPPLTKLSEV